MKQITLILLSIFLFFSSCAVKNIQSRMPQESVISELILGSKDTLQILDYKSLRKGKKKVTWQLITSDIVGLPDGLAEKLKGLDDHKSVDNNTKILVSSSTKGAVILLDRKTKNLLFYAIAPNAHSAEMLPNDRIAIAVSTHKEGNTLEIYDQDKSDVPLFIDSLYSGHGVVWNEKRQLLFALGYDELRAYNLIDWYSENPKLDLRKVWKIPNEGGHDLFAPTEDYFLLSTKESVWKFTIDTEKFTPFEPIANEKKVKSIYYNDANGELIYTKGEITWFTHNIYFKNPDLKINIPERQIYKVRVVEKAENNGQ